MPSTARTKSLPDRARPKAATAPNSGIRTAERGPEILCQRLASRDATGRPASLRSLLAALSSAKERPGINLRQGELVGPHFRRDEDASKPLFAPCGAVEEDGWLQLPFTLPISEERRVGKRWVRTGGS